MDYDIGYFDEKTNRVEPVKTHSARKCYPCLRYMKFGRELTQVDEPPYRGSPAVIFELEAYPEPKALSATQLSALYEQLGTNKRVAEHIGASKNFVQSNKQSNKNLKKGK